MLKLLLLLKIFNKCLCDFLIAFQSNSEYFQNMPFVVFNTVIVVGVSSLIIAVPLDQDVLIKLDESKGKLLQYSG